jgi:MoaA/NifB/PqqE/SkfB family radical SAM enzyme
MKAYCIKPFCFLEVKEGGNVAVCCEHWIKMKNVGRINAEENVWNCKEIKEFRRSILDGDFKFCYKNRCPNLINQVRPVGTIDQLRGRGFHETIINDLVNNRTHLDHGPLIINCCYDMSCNLSCPSCRDSLIIRSGQKSDEILKIQEILYNGFLKDAKRLIIAGSGDPFGSPHYRRFLKSMTIDKIAYLENIHLFTNAVLWDEMVWLSLPEIVREKINTCHISIDAARKETYAIVRRRGNWDKLVNNLSFISSLRKSGKIDNVVISFVVQNRNYKEMKDFAIMGYNYGFDEIVFSKYLNWFHKSEENDRKYAENAITEKTHPRHKDFLKEINDPFFHDKHRISWRNLSVYRNWIHE